MKPKKYSKKIIGKEAGIKIMFFTKYKRPLLVGSIQKRAKETIKEALEDLDCRLIQIRIHPNRVHLEFLYPPRLSLSFIANAIKGRSSYLLRKEFPELQEKCQKALWARRFGMIHLF